MPPKRKLRDEWLANQDFRPWLSRVEDDPTKAKCTTCQKEFNAALTTIKKHKVKFFGVSEIS